MVRPLAGYNHAGLPGRGSALACVVLVLTIVLGTGTVQTLMLFAVPEASGALTFMWLLLYLLAAGGLMLHHGINWMSWVVRYRILLLALLFGAALSVSWSVAPSLSAERVVHLVGASLLAIYLGFMLPLLSLLRLSAVVLGALIVLSAAVAVGLPALGLEDYEGAAVWRGVMNSKNTLGFWAAATVLLCATLSWSETRPVLRGGYVAMAVLALGVLLMSRSATSLLSMVVAGGLCLFLFLAHQFRLGFVRMVAMGVVFIGLIALVVANIDTNDIVGRSDDLTGRAEVWRQTWKLILERPLTGYGYGAIWFPSDSSLYIQQRLTDFTWVVHHAHNGFLHTASEIGLPLTCLALLMIVQQMIEIVYCQYERRQLGVLFVLGFVVAFLISNVSEARFLVHRQLYWIFFLALPISMLRQITLVGASQPQAGATAHSPDGEPWDEPRDAQWGGQWDGPHDGRWGPVGAGATARASASAWYGASPGWAQRPEFEAASTEGSRTSTIHIQTDIDLGMSSHDDPSDSIDADARSEVPTHIDLFQTSEVSGDPDGPADDSADDTLDLTHDADWIDFWTGSRPQEASDAHDSETSSTLTHVPSASSEPAGTHESHDVSSLESKQARQRRHPSGESTDTGPTRSALDLPEVQ